eukprot:scaffold1280_cov379-Prasinococcus_capsulatus_cf.AAC.29
MRRYAISRNPGLEIRWMKKSDEKPKNMRPQQFPTLIMVTNTLSSDMSIAFEMSPMLLIIMSPAPKPTVDEMNRSQKLISMTACHASKFFVTDCASLEFLMLAKKDALLSMPTLSLPSATSTKGSMSESSLFSLSTEGSAVFVEPRKDPVVHEETRPPQLLRAGEKMATRKGSKHTPSTTLCPITSWLCSSFTTVT